MSIRVLVADDHPVVRDGLRAAIQSAAAGLIEVVAEASNGNEVLDLAEKARIDVFVLDISMPVLNGIETAARLLRKDPAARVIILSVHDSRMFVEKALRVGARGYVLKESSTGEIVKAIREVYEGRSFLSPAVTQYIIDGFISKAHDAGKAPSVVTLTSREREILQLLAEGFSAKDIAARLSLSLNTVHVHKKNIMHKLDMHRQADLVRFAIKEGISKL